MTYKILDGKYVVNHNYKTLDEAIDELEFYAGNEELSNLPVTYSVVNDETQSEVYRIKFDLTKQVIVERIEP